MSRDTSSIKNTDDTSAHNKSRADTEPEPFLENSDLHEEYRKAQACEDSKRASKIQWQIAIANQRLIWWFARRLWHKWTPSCLSIQDLAHYGMFGVLRAVEKFKPEFETKLSSYAGWWIKRYIESAIFENGPTIRIPEYRINQKAQIDSAVLELLENGREPTLQNVADELNKKEELRSRDNPDRKRVFWTPDDVDVVNRTTVQIISSIDKPVYEDGVENLHSFIPDSEGMYSPEGASASPFLKKGFRKILESSGLSGRNRLMLELFFYGESRNKAEIARLFTVSKSLVTDVIERFEEHCTDVFKLANASSQDLMSILKFCHAAEKLLKGIALPRIESASGTEVSDEAACCSIPDVVIDAVRDKLSIKFPDIAAIAADRPDLIRQIIIVAGMPKDHRAMLGVYFCGDDLTKQDVGVLCGVSRERVRQIVENFTDTFRGPLSRLFLREFISPRETCEQYIARKYERYAHDIEEFFIENDLEKFSPILKLLFLKRLPHKEIASRLGGMPPGTISNRLKRAALNMQNIPHHIAPFFCGGNTCLTPKEIFARQIWDFLEIRRLEFFDSLAEDEKEILLSRLMLKGTYPKLKKLASLLGRKNAGEVSVCLENIIQNLIEYAGEQFTVEDSRRG